jgi:putative flippase GtrA
VTGRWLKFIAVGALGVLVQLAALGFFRGWLRFEYLTATALAVEAAVLHNFVWHQRWTWSGRAQTGGAGARLLRFHIGNGLVSVLTNLALMRWLVGTLHAPYLRANLLSVAAGSAVNFFVSDRLVFRKVSTADPPAGSR